MTQIDELDALRKRFDDVAYTLATQLAAASSHVVALVAKWSIDDLVPGLSDMDFRIICDAETMPEDWVNIDQHIGRIHTEMVTGHPEWNRINEHTAGAGVSLVETASDRYHHPEHAVWTVWWGRNDWEKELHSRTLARPLDAYDERYHLARFLAYYSPYIHGIDPPINLGQFEPKYALHSRCWHYFAPPMLSAATLLARQHFPGKRAGLAWLAENNIARRQVIAVLDQVDNHYETPEQFDFEKLNQFEKFLYSAFVDVYDAVIDAVRAIKLPRHETLQELKAHLTGQIVDPVMELLDHVRYARIRAGRYYFYLNAPAHFSAGRQLIAEHGWSRKLYRSIFASLRAMGMSNSSPAACIESFGVKVSTAESEALRSMEQLAGIEANYGALLDMYKNAIDWYPDFYRPIERVCQQLLLRDTTRSLPSFIAAP